MAADTAFLCSSFQISLLDMKGEILGVRVTAPRSGVPTGREKTEKVPRRQRKFKQNVTAQLRAAAPDSQ